MPLDWSPLWLSLRYAGLATAFAALVALPLAWLLTHRHFPAREMLAAFADLPLLLPPAVLVYYLLSELRRWPLRFSWRAAIVVSAIYTLPVLLRMMRAGLEAPGPGFENAARSLRRRRVASLPSRDPAARMACPVDGHPGGFCARVCGFRSNPDRGPRRRHGPVAAVRGSGDSRYRAPHMAPAGGGMIQVRMAAHGVDIEYQAGAGITALFGASRRGQDRDPRRHRRLSDARRRAHHAR